VKSEPGELSLREHDERGEGQVGSRQVESGRVRSTAMCISVCLYVPAHLLPCAVTTYLLHSICAVCVFGGGGGVSACAADLLLCVPCGGAAAAHSHSRCSHVASLLVRSPPVPSPEQVLWSVLPCPALPCFVSWTGARVERGSSSSSRATGWLGCIFVGVAEWAGGRIKQEVSTAKVVQCYPWARQAERDRDKAPKHSTRQGAGRVAAG
jgi:hypothetical protein